MFAVISLLVLFSSHGKFVSISGISRAACCDCVNYSTRHLLLILLVITTLVLKCYSVLYLDERTVDNQKHSNCCELSYTEILFPPSKVII